MNEAATDLAELASASRTPSTPAAASTASHGLPTPLLKASGSMPSSVSYHFESGVRPPINNNGHYHTPIPSSSVSLPVLSDSALHSSTLSNSGSAQTSEHNAVSSLQNSARDLLTLVCFVVMNLTSDNALLAH